MSSRSRAWPAGSRTRSCSQCGQRNAERSPTRWRPRCMRARPIAGGALAGSVKIRPVLINAGRGGAASAQRSGRRGGGQMIMSAVSDQAPPHTGRPSLDVLPTAKAGGFQPVHAAGAAVGGWSSNSSRFPAGSCFSDRARPAGLSWSSQAATASPAARIFFAAFTSACSDVSSGCTGIPLGSHGIPGPHAHTLSSVAT